MTLEAEIRPINEKEKLPDGESNSDLPRGHVTSEHTSRYTIRNVLAVIQTTFLIFLKIMIGALLVFK